MNDLKLYNGINNIDDDLIEEADRKQKPVIHHITCNNNIVCKNVICSITDDKAYICHANNDFKYKDINSFHRRKFSSFNSAPCFLFKNK